MAPESRLHKKTLMPERIPSKLTWSMDALRCLVCLIKHLMIRSENLVVRFSCTWVVPSPRSHRRDKKVLVLFPFSRILSMRTFKALRSCPPSSREGMAPFSKSRSRFFMIFLRVGSDTAAAMGQSWKVCIKVLSTYLHPLLLPAWAVLVAEASISATAASKMTFTLSDKSLTSLSALLTMMATSMVALFLAKSSKTWQSCFIPSMDSLTSSEDARARLLAQIRADPSTLAEDGEAFVRGAPRPGGVMGAPWVDPALLGLLPVPGVLAEEEGPSSWPNSDRAGSSPLNLSSRAALAASGMVDRHFHTEEAPRDL